jgi:hypothetical protein
MSAVSIRMYHVGFGDAFLLTFPAADRPRKVLVDCGHHTAGPPPLKMKEVVQRLIADVQEPGGARIDVVICTHRHQDHVRGFEQADLWAQVRVDEVWMPWTEHPSDPLARRIREAQAKRGRDLLLALDSFSGLSLTERERIKALVDNSLTNALAMGTLHHGFAGSPRRRFLPEQSAGGLERVVSAPLLPGVKVHALGPSKDEAVIRDMDPPPDESFLRAARAAAAGASAGSTLARWAISDAGDAFRAWFEEMSERARRLPAEDSRPLRRADPDFLPRWFASLGLRLNEVRLVDKAGEGSPLAAAVALDKAVNGTSLMLLFEAGRAFLLFTGDAQWGTWKRALEDPEWNALLRRTNFYKVGHHGSHNATPVRFVNDVLGDAFQAMVPTRPTETFDDIPRKPLLEALLLKSESVVRSDAADIPAAFRRLSDICIEASVPV